MAQAELRPAIQRELTVQSLLALWGLLGLMPGPQGRVMTTAKAAKPGRKTTHFSPCGRRLG